MANFKLPSWGQLAHRSPWECISSHKQGWTSSSTWLKAICPSLQVGQTASTCFFLFLFHSFSILLVSQIWLELQQPLWVMKQLRNWWWCRKKVQKQRRSLVSPDLMKLKSNSLGLPTSVLFSQEKKKWNSYFKTTVDFGFLLHAT